MHESLPPTPQVVDGPHQLRQQLPTWARIDWFETVDSTNAQLLAAAKTARQPLEWPRLFGAELQTQGRGRAGRVWLNTPGSTLMFSCGFLLEMPARLLVGMAPALGITACQTLRTLAGSQPERLQVKWPNDIMLDDAKLAGILVESRIMGSKILLVVGIGINLKHAQALGAELGRPIGAWSSLEGAEPNKFELAAKLAQGWQDCLHQYNEAKLEQLVTQSRDIEYLSNQMINVLQGDTVIQSGRCLGMGRDGALQLELSSGEIEYIYVGDVSVRAIPSKPELSVPKPTTP